MWGVSLTRPVLETDMVFRRVGSLSDMPLDVIFLVFGRDGICVFVLRRESLSLSPVLESVSSFCGWGVSLTRPVLECVSSGVGGKFLLHAPS